MLCVNVVVEDKYGYNGVTSLFWLFISCERKGLISSLAIDGSKPPFVSKKYFFDYLHWIVMLLFSKSLNISKCFVYGFVYDICRQGVWVQRNT